MASSSQLSFDDDPDIYSLPAVHGDDGSSESTSSSDDDEVPEKKARGKNREFVLHREFNSKQAYDAWWQEERSNWRAGEARVNYNCKATLRVSYVATSEKVAVYLSADGHDHNLDQPHPLSEENKKRIKELSATGFPPKRILSVLQESDTVPCPSLKQIQNLTKRANATKSNKLTDWELKTYCDAHSAQPVEEDACYVIGYAVKSSKQFFVIWSTRRLIERQSNQLLLQCDSTCSTNWYNFPVQVMGYSDLDRHFVPTLIAVSSSEDTYAYQSIFSTIKALGVLPSAVLADGAKEISRACADEFPDAARLMCWAHTIRNCDKRLKSSGLSKDLPQSIRADIEKVQYARSHGEFNRVVELMLNSWPDAAAEFAAYFRKQWVQSVLCNWFEGASGFVSTNNGLESINGVIKKSHTLRRLLPLPQFLDCVEKIVKDWSLNLRAVPGEMNIPPHLFVDAYELLHSGRFWRKVTGEQRFVIASKDSGVISPAQMVAAFDRCTAEFNSFEQYKASRFLVYVVDKEESGLLKCSCPAGSKKRPCKHIVMVMCHPQVRTRAFPPGADAKPLENRRKRGRPKENPRRHVAQVQNRHALADQ